MEASLGKCLDLTPAYYHGADCGLSQTKSCRLSPVSHITTPFPLFPSQQSPPITVTVTSIIQRYTSGNSGILSFRGPPVRVTHLDGTSSQYFCFQMCFPKLYMTFPCTSSIYQKLKVHEIRERRSSMYLLYSNHNTSYSNNLS